MCEWKYRCQSSKKSQNEIKMRMPKWLEGKEVQCQNKKHEQIQDGNDSASDFLTKYFVPNNSSCHFQTNKIIN